MGIFVWIRIRFYSECLLDDRKGWSCPLKCLSWLSKSYLLVVIASPNINILLQVLIRLRRRRGCRHHIYIMIATVFTIHNMSTMMKFSSRVNRISFFESRNMTKISISGSKVLLILPLENVAYAIIDCIKRFAKVITILTIDLEIVVTSTYLFRNHLKKMRQ